MTSPGAYSRLSRPFRGAVVTLAGAALVSGCAVGPNFQRPTPPAVPGYTRQPFVAKTASADVAAGEEQRFVQNQAITQQWWTLFQSPQLDALIDKALAANPTLVVAQTALRQAWELVYAQQGFFYPTVQGNFSASRQQVSGTFTPPTVLNSMTLNFFTLQGTASWTLDVFGGNRRQVESLRAQAESQRFLLAAAYVVLTSNVVAAAVQEASLRGQIAATEDIIAISTQSLALLRRQFDLGYVARLDVAAQEAALAQVRATLPPLRKQLELTRNLLTVLAGRFPSDQPTETFELAALRLPQDLPVSLPSQLVDQRPDVRAAEEALHAAGAQVGVAIANMLPQFTLTGAAGGTSTAGISSMFKTGNPYWIGTSTLMQTLFDGGTLLHRKRAAEVAFEQAAAQYRSTVLTAFQNVADALYTLQTDAESLREAVAAEQAAQVTLDITVKQQQLGYVNYLSLLSAQQAYQQTRITRVQAQANRFADTAALFQALGGGWWNRPDARATQLTDQPSE
jgi:NodT family efflux transporter outer membrane factor (OMF) lipoprotein